MPEIEINRDTNQKKLIDIARIGHDTLLKEHQELQKAVLEIYKFQAIPTPKDEKLIYQYNIENQNQYNINEMKLISAISAFQPVMDDIKTKLYKLEMHPTEEQIQTPSSPQMNMGFLSKLGKQPMKRRILTDDDPYQNELPYLKELRKKVGRFLIFAEYQSYGISVARRASIVGMKRYLNFHRTRFRFEMAPAIVTTHRQYIDLLLKSEKEGIIQMVIAEKKDFLQTRNDLSQQMMQSS